jgi:hypothetical protein
MYKSSS